MDMIRKCNVFVVLNRNKKLQKIYSTKKFLSYINTYSAWKKQQQNKKGSQLPSEIRNSKPEISLSTLFHVVMCFAKNLRDKYAQRLIYEDFHIFLFLNSFYFYLTNLDFLDLWVYTAILNVRTWFTKTYSTKYNVLMVLKGNKKYEKFLPQTILP